jgi:hypothetical protein
VTRQIFVTWRAVDGPPSEPRWAPAWAPPWAGTWATAEGRGAGERAVNGRDADFLWMMRRGD